jgi:hypothetical protein
MHMYVCVKLMVTTHLHCEFSIILYQVMFLILLSGFPTFYMSCSEQQACTCKSHVHVHVYSPHMYSTYTAHVHDVW